MGSREGQSRQRRHQPEDSSWPSSLQSIGDYAKEWLAKTIEQKRSAVKGAQVMTDAAPNADAQVR